MKPCWQQCCVLFCLTLCQWFVRAFDPSSYAESHEVPLSGVTVYWTVNNTHIQLALRAQTTGFIAFGLAEPTVGGMAGSDILVGNVVNDVPSIDDRFAVAKAQPPLDLCQDWQLVAGVFLSALIERLF